MRRRLLLLCVLMTLATAALGKDVYLTIGGSVGNFRTDARIFNPSSEKDITIQAYFLPTSGDNSAVASKPLVVGKRRMVVLNDIVSSHFGASGLGAIRLSSPDDFVATQRIYAQESAGTLGQFVPGLEVSAARKKGVLIQMQANGLRGAKGTFRTNVGFVNPNSVAANVTFRLYDKNDAVVGQPLSKRLEPFGVIAPSEVRPFFNNVQGDFSDSWLSFDSDQPIFGYASVLDNGSEDPTFIPMSEDTGTTIVQPGPPTGNGHVFALRSGSISVAPRVNARAGDQITITVTNVTTDGVTHGFQLVGPNGNVLVADLQLAPGQSVERQVALVAPGTYSYFCTVTACTIAHDAMIGSFAVDADDDGPIY